MSGADPPASAESSTVKEESSLQALDAEPPASRSPQPAGQDAAEQNTESWVNELDAASAGEAGDAAFLAAVGSTPPAAQPELSLALLPNDQPVVPFSCLPDDSVQQPDSAWPAQQPEEEEWTCNLCSGKFAKSAGVRKGPKWFRCKPCIAAIQRIENSAAFKSDLAKENLKKIKRDATMWKDLVLKERVSSARGPANKRRLGSYIEEPWHAPWGECEERTLSTSLNDF
eukprot:11228311-Lingulodinium_polyedra.AAC.1